MPVGPGPGPGSGQRTEVGGPQGERREGPWGCQQRSPGLAPGGGAAPGRSRAPRGTGGSGVQVSDLRPRAPGAQVNTLPGGPDAWAERWAARGSEKGFPGDGSLPEHLQTGREFKSHSGSVSPIPLQSSFENLKLYPDNLTNLFEHLQ